jgi:hypothetical protein
MSSIGAIGSSVTQSIMPPPPTALPLAPMPTVKGGSDGDGDHDGSVFASTSSSSGGLLNISA